jgi:hypothetical protein
MRGKSRGKVAGRIDDAPADGGAAAARGAKLVRLPARPRRAGAAVASPPAPLLTSVSGYQVRSIESGASPGQDLMTVTAPDGRLCLSIALRPEGPVVEVYAESLRLASHGVLRLDCDRLEINAARETVLRTGALQQDVAGDVRTRAGGVVDVEAHAQHLRARLGDIELRANDDVSLDGERVLLNSPRPATRVAPSAPSAGAITDAQNGAAPRPAARARRR